METSDAAIEQTVQRFAGALGIDATSHRRAL
jgi:hypothetical protein